MTCPGKCVVVLLMTGFLQGFWVSSLLSQKDTSVQISGLFDNDNYLELKINLYFDSIFNDTTTNPSYYPAHISYKNDDSVWINIDGEVRVRGHFRKQLQNCDFPPLKVRFDKKSRTNTIFEKAGELKIVTHCQSEIPEYNRYVIQEYLIYKLYEILSDVSYKTRLLKVTYSDINNPSRTLSKFAFFIEDIDLLEERLNAHLLGVQTVMPENVDRDHYIIIAFFQYMIINTDWSLPIMHNIDLISLDYFKPPIPVTFDFDWSGLINIPYKVPTAAGMQTRIPERVYKGPCLSNKEAKRFKKYFEDRKEELFDVYIGCHYINDDIKIESLNKLQLFFQIIEDKYIFNSVFVKKCK